jgi:cell wall assembly regulator SMI1
MVSAALGIMIIVGLMFSVIMAGTVSATPQMIITSGDPPVQVYIGNSYSFTFTTDQPNYLYSGSTYPAWVTVTKTFQSNLIFSGTPTGLGNDRFSIKAYSQVGGGAVWLNWTVSTVQGIYVTSSPVTNGNVSVFYSYALTTNQPNFLLSGSSYPAWISSVQKVHTNDLVFNGTPTATGNYSFTVKLASQVNGGTVTASWYVLVSPTITQMKLTSTPPLNGSVGYTYHYVLTSDQPNVMGVASTYPAWITTVGKTATNNLVFDGVPASAGSYAFAIRVISSVGGGDVWQNWTVIVGTVPYPRFLQDMGTVTMTLNNTRFSYSPTTSIPANLTIIYMPAWMKWKDGTLSGIPTQIGRYMVQVEANSTVYGTKTQQAFVIIVNPVVWPQVPLSNMWLAFIPIIIMFPIVMISSISYETGRMEISQNIFMGSTSIGVALLVWCNVFPLWAIIITGSLIAVMIMRMNSPAVVPNG